MSIVLARIRVRETAGIRRFLYPLSITLPSLSVLKTIETKMPEDIHDKIALRTAQGQGVPSQTVCVNFSTRDRIDFAVSLSPGETQEIVVTVDDAPGSLSDPLQTTLTLDGGLKNTQEHFGISLSPNGCISEVVYDGVRHLRGPSRILRNEEAAWNSSTSNSSCYRFYSQLIAKSRYKDGGFAQTKAALTACKSWAAVTHTLEQPKPNDEIVFTLPLAVTSPTLTCDFGVGGYVFGKLDGMAAPEVVWRTEFGNAPHAWWSVKTAGRVDYVGEVETAEAFLPQRWFHLIDSDKALAVAITKVPPDCREMTVRLTHGGDVSVAFRLGDTVTGPAEFGVCYHFLNDVPAIAAATNPQSILLPPRVEVLPA